MCSKQSEGGRVDIKAKPFLEMSLGSHRSVFGTEIPTGFLSRGLLGAI